MQRSHQMLAVCAWLVVALGAGVGSLRGEELRRLVPTRILRLTTAETGEPPVVVGVSLSPGGEWLAAAGDDHQVWMWNAIDGQLLHRLAGHADWVRAVQFSPEGDRLVSAGNDRQILWWDAAAGRRLEPQAAHPQVITALAYDPTGRHVAAVGFEDRLRVYSTEGELRQELECACIDNRSLAFSLDGSLLAVGGRNGTIRVWNTGDWSLLHELKNHTRRIRALAFSPDGGQLASAGEDRLMLIHSLDDGRLIHNLDCDRAKIFALVYLDPRFLVYGGSDNVIRVWDLELGGPAYRLDGHTGTVATLSYDRESGVMASGSFDTTIRLWDMRRLDRDESTRLPQSSRVQ